ncbi:alpha,alpha-phosphotrehalase [Aerococcaceae bacterium zg-ZJ1578]|uniref:alpha,alpha-phosphotrehalase n=1 Tax=Aerococcaceae TaxID=186827 RepID=UPI0013BB6D2C|nr:MULTISPECIES: alpha,alpha-phosphotrehalase [unclassified Facklamia]MBK0348596.1 alpha,alpha-phosphotrehalase [Aerococcaceae bacterium zg-1578]NEW64945.1 alpha,alpha-phosphotrehalase [Facklamia sp. 252]NEW68406.1 alpha,alpha-phosphotrehalase [Facklamia sp. 253]QQD65545.1 alpha,alpha-phosphotrehalase [Aerococcaceae bacterium zg-252]
MTVTVQEKIIYQLYPKSFKDTTGNGIGDLEGVIEKMPYLSELGINMIWMNPFYPSPQNDNGYDISDYTDIDSLFGTMETFERLVAEGQKYGIDIMLDMVFNHTSTEHQWFKKALAGDKYYQDFYYLRPAKSDGSLPTNWESKFGGAAWAPFGDTDLYYLHLYDVTQADLNWHNENVRKELHKVVRFWLEKGVKGFRFDVLNVIGKDEDLIDSQAPGSSQEKSLYTDTPIVHEWINELNQQTFGLREDIVTVGEMSSTTIENGIRYTNPEEKELSMIFSFHHLKVDYENGDKWSNPPFRFLELKQILNDWQQGMSDHNGWNALFLNNHDQPRSNSRFGDVENYPYETQTMLATTIQFLRGTPFIYQGEEIGMTNPNYDKMDQYNDIETHNNYKLMLDKGYSIEKAMDIIQSKSRDNSRTPMQWDSSLNAGFSSGTPWLAIAENYQDVNVKQDQAKEKSIFNYYQRLIALRKSEKALIEGTYTPYLLSNDKVMAYFREYQNERILVISHFYAGEVTIELPSEWSKATKLIGNGNAKIENQHIILNSYETIVFKFEG